ncbi:uncharacterized protein LOC136088739 isoform X3 [Hydra vulgaris]|uniref:Uncharacterized protein LOC136088739 isoform X3 n=1 Tax=Hydra vulgaris TaxID=6087 RepID=A0ABM4D4Y7_HYDVU
MEIYEELGGSKLYDYSLQDTLIGCLSNEIVYVYLSLIAKNQQGEKNIEVLAPAGFLSQKEIPLKTNLIRKQHLIIKPKEKIVYHVNPLGELDKNVKNEEIK